MIDSAKMETSMPPHPLALSRTWQQQPTWTLPLQPNVIKSCALQKCRHVKIWKDDVKDERWTGWQRAVWDNKIKAIQEPRWIDESIEWRWQPASKHRGQRRRISRGRNDAFKRAKAARVGSLAGRERGRYEVSNVWGGGERRLVCRWSGDVRNI